MIRDPKLHENSVINGQILVTSYFDPDGKLKYCVGVNGDLNIAQALGLLDLAKLSVYRLYQKNNEDDDEIEEDEDEYRED